MSVLSLQVVRYLGITILKGIFLKKKIMNTYIPCEGSLSDKMNKERKGRIVEEPSVEYANNSDSIRCLLDTLRGNLN